MAEARYRLTLKKSLIGRGKKHQATVKGLGLKKINQTIEVDSTPEILGMIKKVSYLLSVEELSNELK